MNNHETSFMLSKSQMLISYDDGIYNENKTKHSIVAVQLLLSSSWETSLQNNGIFHWLGANLESSLNMLLFKMDDIDGLVQDCSNSTASALELLQSLTKPSI